MPMSASGSSRPEALAQSEYLALRVLCQADLPVRLRVREKLQTLRWSAHFHEVLFKVITGFPATHFAHLREELPAHLTRRGFPDFDCVSLFVPHGLTVAQVEELVRVLAGNAAPGGVSPSP